MEDTLRTERETRKFRLLALLFLVVGLYFQRQDIFVWPAVALALFYLVYTVFLLYFLIKRLPVQWLPYVMLAVDTAWVSGILSIFGVESAFFAFFPIIIIYYAIYLGYAGSLLSATLISFSYIGLAYAQQADVGLGRLLPIQIPLFYVIALFSGYLAQRRFHEQRERQELALILQAERGARSMLDLTMNMASALDLEQLQREFLQIAAGAADCSHGAIALVDDSTGELGALDEVFPQTTKRAASKGKRGAGESAKLEREVLEAGKLKEILEPTSETLPVWARELTPTYALLVPLADDNGPKGLLWLLSTRHRSSLSATQSELIQNLARFFVPLLANAKAYASAQKQSARLSSELRGAVNQMVRTQKLQKKTDVNHGQLRLLAAQEEAWYGSQRLELSAREFDVLYLLALHGGRPVSQEVLLREVWGDEGQTRSNVVDVSINRLRRKLATQAEAGELVQTVRGVGYRIDGLPASNGNGTEGKRPRGQKGSLLLEHVISLAVVAILVPPLLAVLTAFVNNSDVYHDRAVALELAQSQMESIVKEPFQPSPASYSLIAPLPNGYSIAVATGEATRYTYANGSAAPEVLQAITVTVTGRYSDLQTKGFKYRR